MDLQEDLDRIDRMIADGEASYNKWRHPDPYIGKYTHEWTDHVAVHKSKDAKSNAVTT